MSNNMLLLKEVKEAGVFAWDAAPFLHKVTEIVPSIIYVFNQDTQSNEYSNHSIGTSLGYSAEEVQSMGANIMPQLCHPEDIDRVFAHFAKLQTIADGEVLQLQYRVRHKCGTWVWLLSNDTVFERDQTGRVIRHIGVAADITPQKTAEENALRAHKRASALNAELRAFAYSMSHDMKAPSNTLTMLLKELLDAHGASFDADALELMDMARQTVGQMKELVDSLLSYALVLDQDIAKEPVPLKPVVTSVLDAFADRIEQREATVALSDLPVVHADKTQMRNLFENLIGNALKFHRPDCPPQVEIAAVPEPDTSSVRICVKDRGIGIPPQKQQKIFTIFKRLNADGDYSGCGLGLAICKQIAANHDTAIAVESTPGVGTTFSIRLKTL